jgi:pyruvate ferredoxin oxidoreductase gamma subunit
MFRVRFHGRGGQGIKTAGRILGTAFFLEGFEVQDAPRYGAERRGAPIFSYVRAAQAPVRERGVIHRPDLVVVADETLVQLPAAHVDEGVGSRTVLLINSRHTAEEWRRRFSFSCRLVVFDGDRFSSEGDKVPAGAVCAGAAARLLGVISRSSLTGAIDEELAGHGAEAVAGTEKAALAAFDALAGDSGLVSPQAQVAAGREAAADWVELAAEAVPEAAPVIIGAGTSRLVQTGLWRTRRPVLDRSLCSRCHICLALCPEGAIGLDEEGFPDIDYRHCKGCLICAAQCPRHAIHTIPEADSEEEQPAGEES